MKITNFKIRVITTWNDRLYKEYAYRFEHSYKRHWTFPLTVYNEDKDLFDLIPECKEFIDRNKHSTHKDFLRTLAVLVIKFIVILMLY